MIVAAAQSAEPFAGYLAGRGELSFALTLTAATVGSNASAYV